MRRTISGAARGTEARDHFSRKARESSSIELRVPVVILENLEELGDEPRQPAAPDLPRGHGQRPAAAPASAVASVLRLGISTAWSWIGDGACTSSCRNDRQELVARAHRRPPLRDLLFLVLGALLFDVERPRSTIVPSVPRSRIARPRCQR